MSETIKGKLRKTRSGFVVVLPPKKGKEVVCQISQSAKQFRDQDAADGCEVDVLLENGQPVKVTIPGKPEVAPGPGPSAPPPRRDRHGSHPAGHGLHSRPTSRPPQGPGAGRHGNRETDTARRDATAPYNFIPVNNSRLAVGFQKPADPAATLSGRIACTLEALTPILVAGPQDADDRRKPRTFFTVDGQPVIPASSLKGAVRSVLETLSFSRLAPLSPGRVFFRRVGDRNEPEYQAMFVHQEGREPRYRPKTRAGYLEIMGADVRLYPAEYARVPYRLISEYLGDNSRLFATLGDPERRREVGDSRLNEFSAAKKTDEWFRHTNGQEISFTLHPDEWHKPNPESKMELCYKKVVRLGDGPWRGCLVFSGHVPKKAMDFIFYNVSAEALKVDDAVYDEFREQLTRAQEELLELYTRKLKLRRWPVFWVADDSGRPLHLGLAQLFRIAYKHSPETLSRDHRTGRDFCQTLFGYADQKDSLRGRVLFSHATLIDAPTTPRRYGPIVPGSPRPSCLAHYLVQPPGDQRVYLVIDSRHRRNQLISFNHSDARLRGRKAYWHRDPDFPKPPNENPETQAVYHPLPDGVRFRFSVDFQGLSEPELGGLLEALDLPKGHAHKIGLGKPFGLGSARITVEHIDCYRGGELYTDLAARVTGARPGSPIDREALRNAFRTAVASKLGFDPTHYETQPEIRCLRLMMDYYRRPPNSQTAYLPLSTINPTTAAYIWRPILPDPHEINREQIP